MPIKPRDIGLEGILDHIWSCLEDGVKRAKSEYHIPSVATVTEGGLPSVRSVVLRQAKRSENLLAFHTDRRAPKFQEARDGAHVAFHFYAPSEKNQIRILAESQPHLDDEDTKQIYQSMPARCQRVYLTPSSPGEEFPEPVSNIPEEFIERNPTPEEGAPGYANFSVIYCKILEIDTLYLDYNGHVRAQFDLQGDEIVSRWVCP